MLTTAVLFYANLAIAEDMVWLDYPESGVVLGQGYNLLEDKASYGTCVDFIPVQDPSQFISFNFDEVNSHSEVISKTNISASGSMKMAILNASARLKFLSNETFKLDTTTFYLNAEVTNSSLFAAPSIPFKRGVSIPQPLGGNTNIDWKDKSKSLNGKIKIDPIDVRNYQKCGHGFVAAIISGAAVDSFLSFSKSDANAISDINGGLKADIAGIFKVSGSFEQRQESTKRQDRTKISLFRYGGESGGIAYDLAGLKDSIKNLTQDAVEAPKPIRIGVLPYRSLDTHKDLNEPYSAFEYTHAINAYFLARDVFEKTSEAIQVLSEIPIHPQDRESDIPIVIAKNITHYIDLNDRSMALAGRISNALRRCQEVTTRFNEELQVSPEEESHTSSNKSISDAPKLRRFPLDKIDTDENAPYGALTKILSDSSDSTLNERFAACKPDDNEGYFSVAVQQALQIAAEELSIRPIYGNDLGVRLETELKDKVLNVQGSPATRQTAYLDILKTYTINYRADQFRRSICSFDFTHPICTQVNASEWRKKAVLDSSKTKVDLIQIEKEFGEAQ